VRLTGKLPGWALGGGEALPGAAAMDWSRWGMSPGYFRDDPACDGWYQPDQFKGHMQLWSIDDDKTFGPVDAVDALAACFDQSNGEVERLHLNPGAVGLKAVGHFGVFQRVGEAKIWPLVLNHIEAKVPLLRPDASVSLLPYSSHSGCPGAGARESQRLLNDSANSVESKVGSGSSRIRAPRQSNWTT
jgi:hypothetical protein